MERIAPFHESIGATLKDGARLQAGERQAQAEQSASLGKAVTQLPQFAAEVAARTSQRSRYFGNSYGMECEGWLLAAGELED